MHKILNRAVAVLPVCHLLSPSFNAREKQFFYELITRKKIKELQAGYIELEESFSCKNSLKNYNLDLKQEGLS